MLPILLSVIVGLSIVLQNGLNHRISHTLSMGTILTANCIISLALSVGLLLITRLYPEWVPDTFRPTSSTLSQAMSRWWILIPGVCGFLIILSMPVAIGKIGVLKVLAIVIAIQLGGGMLWDYAVEGITPSLQRIAGSIITLAGAWVALSG